MSNKSKTPNNKPCTVQDIIRTIEEKSAEGGYIFRGEPECYEGHPYYGKVSSALWREYGVDVEHCEIEIVQNEMLNGAKKHLGDLSQDADTDFTAVLNVAKEHTDETVNFEILTEIQHYGGKTNLIDFTEDFFIALFFACDGHHDEPGRVILQKSEEIKNMINHPRNPRHRVIAQKSVFVRPPKGFIEPREDEIVIVPANLKRLILGHLRTYHGISTETIYNDLHGFIRNQDIHEGAYTQFYRAFAYQEKRDNDKAIQHYSKALDLNPQIAEAYSNRGIAYGDKGDYPHAIENFNKAIELKPDYPDAYNNRGTAYREIGNLDRAIEDCDTAIQLQPGLTQAYNNRGNAYKDKGDYPHAIEDFNKAIELKPDYAEAHSNRGLTYKNKGEYTQAIKDLDAAIQLNPNFAEAYNNRGNIYMKKGEVDCAIEDYTEAIERNPEFAMAYSNRGSAYADTGDFDRAIEDYTEAIELRPDFVDAYYNRGTAFQRKNLIARAIEDYTKAIQLKPDCTNAYNNRGAAFSEKGDFDRAIEDYTKAIDLNPNYAGAYNNRGVTYSNKGDVNCAIEDYTKAIAMKSNYANAYYNRGMAWSRQREWKKAKLDLMNAKDQGIDIITSFRNEYENVQDFEQKNNVTLPEDIAVMLTPTAD